MKKRKDVKKFIIIMVIIISAILLFNIPNKYGNNKENNNNQNINNNNISEKIFDDYDVSNKTYDDVSISKYEEGTILDRLKAFSKLDTRINKIIADYDSYPETLLLALSANIELTPFTLDYNTKKGHVYSDDIGPLSNEVPELFQWDERWGYGDYGNSNIALSGCGPTSLSMVVTYFKGDNTITPYKVAKMAEEKGYYLDGSGTTWDLIRYGAKEYGLTVNEIPLSESKMVNALKKGHLIICNMRKGDFTINGHYIVIVDYIDNKFKIHDPNSRLRSNMLWEYDRIESQIKNLWELYI